MLNRLPPWFKQEIPSKEARDFYQIIRNKFRLSTICYSAKCPNKSVCFSKKHATFLILGEHCARSCRFCNVENNSNYDREENGVLSVDSDEVFRIAKAVKYLNLEYVVITSVTRDDLSDGGAQHFARTIKGIKEFSPATKIEILIPDFQGSQEALGVVVKEKPVVISHNLETVKNLYPVIRDKADYKRSLEVIGNIKLINSEQTTKSSIMLGLGETDLDLAESLRDLRNVNCDMLVLGQYLRPSLRKYPVQKFYSPEEFNYWERFAYNLGFKDVCAFPLARTSYQMKTQFME